MKNKYLYYLIFGIITYFSLFLTVFASETSKGGIALYGNREDLLPLSDYGYNTFKEYFENFINEHGVSENTYILTNKDRNSYYHLFGLKFNYDKYFSDFNYNLRNDIVENYCFNITFSENEANISPYTNCSYRDSTIEFGSLFTNESYYLLWSNKQLRYENDIDSTKDYKYYSLDYTLDSFKNFYNNQKISIYEPIYTYANLLFHDYEVKEPVTVAYKIEYYFDDILDSGKTEYKTGKQYDVISSYEDYATDMYKLVDGSYSIILNEDESLNVLKVYYRSPLYGTEKSPVETKNQRVWFFFQFSDLKTIFPNVEFGNFTQYQQLVITILVNIFFCLFLLFISYITLKAVFKCWSWIMGFIT